MPGGCERASDVRRAVCAREAGLPPRCGAGADEERPEGHVPELCERRRQARRGHVPALPAALAVARHERQRDDGGACDDLHDEAGEERRELAASTLLPGGDERSGTGVVDERRACPGEPEPAAAALDAAPDGPGAGAAAALAHRRGDAHERVAARVAQRGTGHLAAGAPGREEQAEQTHASTVGDEP